MSEVVFYVVLWHHSDLSGFGVVAIRETKEQADRLVAFLREQEGQLDYSIQPASMEPV